MKIRFLIIAMLTACSIVASASTNETRTVTLIKSTLDPPVESPSPAGRRTPPAPVICTLDFSNKTVSGLDDTILTYEVCDSDTGEAIAVFTVETDLIEYLGELSGTLTIALTTETYLYTGYVDLD